MARCCQAPHGSAPCGGPLDAREQAACAQVLAWTAEAFLNVPTRDLASRFPWEDMALVGKRLVAAARVQDCMEALRSASDADLGEARVEYTALFCSPHPDAPFPYESVYSTEERLLMRPSRDEVVAAYEEVGFMPAKGDGYEPEDHLSNELGFLAHLLAEEAAAASGQQSRAGEDVQLLGEARRRFVADHAGAWLPRFAAEVRERASLPLYPALADLARDLVGLVA